MSQGQNRARIRRATEVQKVKNEQTERPKKHASRPVAKLSRTTFQTSREMDFFSRKELVTQTAHEVHEWPLVFIKEAIDNALDACEVAGIAPVIEVRADAAGIEVRDNGVGLPEATLKAAMNFSIRASDKEAYVSPCRGAQGNALKTLLPMPTVLDEEHGRFVVEAHGQRHTIRCGVDPISQRALIHDDTTTVAPGAGTLIRMQWQPRSRQSSDSDGHEPAWPFGGQRVAFPPDRNPSEVVTGLAARCWHMVHGFAVFNPHATIRVDWFGQAGEWQATDTAWDKWRPDKPTSPHWYEQAHFERLVAAYVTAGRDTGTDRLVSEFLAEFDGLSGSIKRGRVLADADMKRARLSDLVSGDRLDGPRIAMLREAMQRHTRPVKSRRLGVIGEEHFRQRFLELGILPESFQYARHLEKDGSPAVVETAFGRKADEDEDESENQTRHIFAGANWSMAIGNPFRTFGDTGEGLEAVLADQRSGRGQPIVFALHLAAPRVEWKDRGKSSLSVEG